MGFIILIAELGEMSGFGPLMAQQGLAGEANSFFSMTRHALRSGATGNATLSSTSLFRDCLLFSIFHNSMGFQ
jgi:hypothetical protein